MSLTVQALNEPELASAARAAAEIAHPIFCMKGWTWGWTHPHVPTVDEMTKFLLELAEKLIERRSLSISSGRFRVIAGYDGPIPTERRTVAPDRITFNLELGEFH